MLKQGDFYEIINNDEMICEMSKHNYIESTSMKPFETMTEYCFMILFCSKCGQIVLYKWKKKT